ncbi:MAG TPA: hypothetical protein DCM05_15860 [Elusimicrobia bacterium]|nr:hypothetical protein [Elusimicrobiota bacterium]
MKRTLSVAAAVLISFVLLAYAFRNVDFREVFRILSGVRLGWLPLLVAVGVSDLWIRAWRWKLLLAPVAEAGSWTLFKLQAVGLGLNNLLFLRIGEFARGYFAGKVLGIGLWSALSTILIERLCDMAALLVLFGVSSASLGTAISPALRHGALFAAAGVLVLLFGVTMAEHALDRLEAWKRLPERHPKVHRLVEELILGSKALRAPGRAAGVAALSFALWLCDALIYWGGAQALGFDPPISYPRAVSVLAAAAGAVALPALPGAFGNFEAGVKAILVHYGYNSELALSYATFLHLVMYAVVTSLGIFFLHGLGYNLAGLGRRLGEAQAEAEKP